MDTLDNPAHHRTTRMVPHSKDSFVAIEILRILQELRHPLPKFGEVDGLPHNLTNHGTNIQVMTESCAPMAMATSMTTSRATSVAYAMALTVTIAVTAMTTMAITVSISMTVAVAITMSCIFMT